MNTPKWVNKPLQAAKILESNSIVLAAREAERKAILDRQNRSIFDRSFDTWIKRCWFGATLGYAVHIEWFKKTTEWERVQYVGLHYRIEQTDDEGIRYILKQFGCEYFTMHGGVIWGFKTLQDFDNYGRYLARRESILKKLLEG